MLANLFSAHASLLFQTRKTLEPKLKYMTYNRESNSYLKRKMHKDPDTTSHGDEQIVSVPSALPVPAGCESDSFKPNFDNKYHR